MFSKMAILVGSRGPLVGEEMLLLPAIPANDLLLTKETEDNIEDLVGNAMSTTVVGVCTLSALLFGQVALSSGDEGSSSGNTLSSLDRSATFRTGIGRQHIPEFSRV